MRDDFLGGTDGLLGLLEARHQMLDHLILLLGSWSLRGHCLKLFLKCSQVRIVFLLLFVHGFL
jgi:hypothetical protein